MIESIIIATEKFLNRNILEFINHISISIEVEAGTIKIHVAFDFNSTIHNNSFDATLNGQPLTSFTPVPGGSETVEKDLIPGRNLLRLECGGIREDGHYATDKDKLTFNVE